MKQDNHAANGSVYDPLFATVQRFTAPVALVGILFTLVIPHGGLLSSSSFGYTRACANGPGCFSTAL